MKNYSEVRQFSLQKLNWLVYFSVFLAIGVQYARGDDGADPFSILKNQFTSLTSIDVVGTYTCLSYDPSIADPSKNPYEKVQVHFREQGDRYWFEVKELQGTNVMLPSSMIWAFNGTNSQYYDQSGLLSIKKGPLEKSTYAAILFHPLAGYVPFYPYDRTKVRGYLPRLTDFNDPSIWQKSVAKLLPTVASLGLNKDLLCYTCKATGEGRSFSDIDLKFGLDPVHGYAPIVWERWKEGHLIISSQVLELGEFKTSSGSKFYFPKRQSFAGSSLTV